MPSALTGKAANSEAASKKELGGSMMIEDWLNSQQLRRALQRSRRKKSP
jgi:hypothetical protein